MVDILYNVLARPIPNEPDKKDAYHVDKAPKDAGVKRLEDDDPSSGKQDSKNQKDESKEQKGSKEEPKGKGKFKDKDGVEHLDIFV